jgi:hypothetical protein
MRRPLRAGAAAQATTSLVQLPGYGSAAAIQASGEWLAGLNCTVGLQGSDGGPPLGCHKAVLSACSPVLSRMFDGSGDLPGAALARVAVPSAVLRTLVEAAYSRLLLLSEDCVLDLYAAANFLDMQAVCDECVFFVKTEAKSAASATRLLARALELNLSNTDVFHPVLANAAANFYRLDVDALLELALASSPLTERLLSSPSLMALSERQVLDFALKLHGRRPELNALNFVRYCCVDAVLLPHLLPADFVPPARSSDLGARPRYFYAPLQNVKPGFPVKLHPNAYDFTAGCLALLCAPPFSLTAQAARARADEAFSCAHLRLVVLQTHPATASTPATAKLGPVWPLPVGNTAPPPLTWLPQSVVLTMCAREFDLADV